ncbi:MAG: L-threonylcarbamoyladenylate synthase [Bacteroidales bacterium]
MSSINTSSETFKQDIENALKVLRDGGIILYPTDTIWGLGCDATNKIATERIYNIKQRHSSKSMIVLLADIGMIESYTAQLPDVAFQLLECTTKPTTIIYDGAKNLADNIVAEDNSIAIRITDEVFSQTLARKFKRPIVSTSANIAESASPTTFRDIDSQIIESVDYVVKYRQDDHRKTVPSSIIKLQSDGRVVIIRE